MFASPTPKISLHSWHSRLGHPSSPILKVVVSKFSLSITHSLPKDFSCIDCLINKSHKLPFYSNTITAHKPLECLYTDVWTLPIISGDNFIYYVILSTIILAILGYIPLNINPKFAILSLRSKPHFTQTMVVSLLPYVLSSQLMASLTSQHLRILLNTTGFQKASIDILLRHGSHCLVNPLSPKCTGRMLLLFLSISLTG